MKQFLLAGAAIWAVFAAPALAADLEPAKIAEHVKVLSSDAFEGRGPATEGEKKTVAYISEQFKAAGLKPGGDLVNGQRSWTQDVPLARFEIKGPVAVGVTTGGKAQAWTQGDDVALRAAQTGATRVSIKDAPVVFVGYGVTAPERNWDDFKDVDLKGKVALVLVNDPDFETGNGDFGGKAMTYYGRWTYKYEEAARRGAVGFLVVHETAPASYGWATVKNSNTAPLFDIIRDKPSEAHALLEGWIQRDRTVELFKASGLDFEALKKQAQTRDFKPVELKGATFSTDYEVDVQKIVSKNVVGLIPGAKRPDETIIYSGHWDHLGVGLPDAKGDAIYNGAVDNADGIATMIEIGRAFAKGPQPDRSVVFLAVTAEEKGLLGSEYYAANPLYPLGKTVANINMDALSPAGPAKDFTSSGDAASTLQDALIAVGKAQGRYYTPDSRPEAGLFFRSDHFPFAKRGVPAISFGSGSDLVQGGKEAGAAWSKAYTADRYHQPADHFDDSWNLEGIAQDGQLMLELGRQLADSTTWPEWKAGSEFKQTRDATASERK
ncbi:peptidase M20 [Phenylobacterium sp. Root77]|uniref:M28 family metallopeptidase n=1 Tax=unclassified Phenylobacterium TaxID=2640670 RepID=UPI0006F5335A|nr:MULTISPECIES: M28 family metallopeptidase [unclassified Phenylobacterium]KQW73353.1 peptidase M20 [Phenylobacterium sp. Root1277]KQW92572.1 peptidase M20 [Phenylobacterium sp. Root1290]KRC40801.1 peptidase M20 [Phenylobacterium sp. Root77]